MRSREFIQLLKRVRVDYMLEKLPYAGEPFHREPVARQQARLRQKYLF
jgi:hypothetical protein